MTEIESNQEVTPLLPRQRQGSWEIDAKKPAKKPPAWYIIAPVFALTFCLGAMYAPMIQFYTVIFCYKYYQSQTGDTSDIPLENCAIPEVQAIVSEAQAVFMLLGFGSTLLFAGYYGALSDRKGRRMVLLICGLGHILSVACLILTTKHHAIFGVSLLFISPVIRGAFVGDTVMLATAQAYISDCSTPSERTIAFGRILATIFLGTTVGPTVSSLLIKQTGTINSVFYMVLFVTMLFELYIFFILPESHDFVEFQRLPKKEEKSLLHRINIFSALRILFRASSKHANSYALPLIAGIQFLVSMLIAPPTILYAMLTFGWTAYESGLYFSLSSFSKLIILAIFLPFISKLFHRNRVPLDNSDVINNPKIIIKQFTEHDGSASSSTAAATIFEQEGRSEQDIKHSILFDTSMIRVGAVAEVLCFVAFGLVASSKGFAITAVLHSFAALALPSLRSLTTTLVSSNEVGELLGAMAVVESCGMLFAQLTINTIYSASVGTMPQLAFFVCAFIASIGLLLSLFVRPSSSTTAEEDA